ncbi:MAG: sigma-70 family RNA polymerase sigma factor [Chloroflexota bacterium]|nr:sigma-70 family RNA polymerase sigma factor [Chloroflexota bacterium]
MDQDKHAAGVSVRINNENHGSHAPEQQVEEVVSDEALAARVARGDNAALESLYDRYAARVLGVTLKVIGDRAVAEDVLQETFWRVWKSAATFQRERGSFASWLFRIARNLAIDAYRRQSVRPQALYSAEEDPVMEATADPSMDVAEQAQSLLVNRQMRVALAALPRAQRQVIEMAYFYGMTRQEIAEATGEALGTVHTRARLALSKLREALDQEEFEG